MKLAKHLNTGPNTKFALQQSRMWKIRHPRMEKAAQGSFPHHSQQMFAIAEWMHDHNIQVVHVAHSHRGRLGFSTSVCYPQAMHVQILVCHVKHCVHLEQSTYTHKYSWMFRLHSHDQNFLQVIAHIFLIIIKL